MTSSELAKRCVASGFIPENLQIQASQAFAQAYEKKGEIEVEEKILSRMKRNPIRSIAILEAIINELPDKPKEELVEDDIALTIEEEIAIETADFREIKETIDMLGDEFRKPNDPKFDDDPNIFMALPYRSMPKDLQDKYKANTFLVVLREATKAKTSMHEICRRKGLTYGLLLA